MRLSQKTYDKPNDGGAAPSSAPAAPTTVLPADPPVVAPAAAPAAPPAPAPAPEPPKKDWKDDRIAKLTHDLNEERRLKAAAAAPATVQTPGETPEAFQARVDEAANAKAVQIAAQVDWDRKCDVVAIAGKKDFPDFMARLGAIQSTINPKDPAELAAYSEVIAAAIETGDAAHKVIYALGADPGEYQRIMKLSPVKRAMELGTMAAKLIADPEPSGLPKPITPVGSGGVHYEGITPDDPTRGTKLPMKEWMKQREQQARERGIQ